jgi:bla regulator protein blaR1
MDAIANHVWQSTIFAAGAGVTTVMFRRNSASVRYWLWFSAALKFLIPFAALSAAADYIPLPEPPRAAGAAVDAAITAFRTSAVPAVPLAASILLVIVWISGVVLVLARWFTQWRDLIAHARRCPEVVDGTVHDKVRRVERSEGITTRISIVASDRAFEPGVIGVWSPMLIWPQRLTAELNDAQVEAIVAHEVCHVMRRDNLLAFAQVAVSAAFWFHPLVWFIGARLVDERERACDEHVVARGGSPATYAESILKTCQLCLASPIVNAAGITGGELKSRIGRVMKNTPAESLGIRKKAALVLASVLVLLVPLLATNGPRVATKPLAQDNDREVHRPGRGVTTPRLLREVKPEYPERAKQEGVQGEVLMECVVKADGTVGDKKIVKSLHPDLDQAALDAAAQWVFEPGKRDGKPVNVLVTIAMAFTLKK